jgi:hypothetical protein
MKLIAGIGSRETPPHILKEMFTIGDFCRSNKIYIRSGHAAGADSAFEEGAQEYCIAYLPWITFQSDTVSEAKRYTPTDQEFIALESHAALYHPAWNRLSSSVKKLMARNSAQILGKNLDRPVECWTSDGEASGGTGQALRIAKALDIPIFNMFHKKYSTAALVTPLLK